MCLSELVEQERGRHVATCIAAKAIFKGITDRSRNDSLFFRPYLPREMDR